MWWGRRLRRRTARGIRAGRGSVTRSGAFVESPSKGKPLTASAGAAQMIRTTGGQTQGTESPAPSTIRRCRRNWASATRMQGVSGSARAHAHGGHAASPTRHAHRSPTCCLQWMRPGRAVDRCGRPPRRPCAPSTSRYYSILLYNTSIHFEAHHDHREICCGSAIRTVSVSAGSSPSADLLTPLHQFQMPSSTRGTGRRSSTGSGWACAVVL